MLTVLITLDPAVAIIILMGNGDGIQAMDVAVKLAVSVQMLCHCLGRPTKLRFLIKVGKNRFGLQFAVQMSAVLSKELVGPLLEVLTHGSQLFTTFDTAQWRHDATAARFQREIETHALGHQCQVELPVLLAVLGAHQVLTEIVADGARFMVVVQRCLHVIIVREGLWPDTSLSRRVVA